MKFAEVAAIAAVTFVVVSLVLVLAPSAAADDPDKPPPFDWVKFELHKRTCMNNVRNIVGLLETTGIAYPMHRGADLILYLVKRGEIVQAKHIALLFCPGDKKETFKKAGGLPRYKKIVLGQKANGALTSYSGRDQLDKKCAAKKGDAVARVLIADDDEHHHAGKGLIVGFTGGAAKWRDKVKTYLMRAAEKITVGPKSTVEELKCLRVD